VLMKAAIRDDDPVLFFEDRLLYAAKAQARDADERLPLGRGRIVRAGRDVTLVAIGRMVGVAQAAAQELAREGIEAEIIDPRSLVPLDEALLLDSVKRTHRALVMDAAPLRHGVTGEIASVIGEKAFDWLDAPVGRLGATDTPVPISRSLEPFVSPTPARVAAAVRKMM
jgi:pyruvate/2-oxoglutarate/acetoin dehydrogenase E1 component